MASWHLFRRLAIALRAHAPTISHRLIPLSSSLLAYSSSSSSPSSSFFSSFKLRNQWLPHGKFSAATSSEALVDDSLTIPYLSVLIHCPKDVALYKRGEYILDYGTGSGILSIAALKLGAAFAVGIDIDSQAIASASQNATLNNLGPEKMQLYLVPGKTPPSSEAVEGQNRSEIAVATEKNKYDVVVANILLNPLIDLADQIVSCAKTGAIIGLSGILCEQVQHILERYSPFLEGTVVSEMDGWACVSGRKRSNLDVC